MRTLGDLMNYLLPAVVLLSTVTLTSCSSLTVDHADGRSPEFVPQEFFSGKLCADGVVRDRSGAEIRRFNAELQGEWNDLGEGTLDEVFMFYDEPGADPVRETRLWSFTPVTTKNGPALEASAGDVPEPTIMRWAGNAVYMSYTLRYGQPGDTIDLHMEDWMFRVSDDVVVNETKMSKFGLHVGQILLVMRRVPDSVSCL